MVIQFGLVLGPFRHFFLTWLHRAGAHGAFLKGVTLDEHDKHDKLETTSV